MLARIARVAVGTRFPDLQRTAFMAKDIDCRFPDRQSAGWVVRSAKGFNAEIVGGQWDTGKAGDLYEIFRESHYFNSHEVLL